MRGSSGLTLVEVLVTLAIVGIALSFIVPSFVANARINQRMEVRSQATQVARSVLDAVRRQQSAASIPTSGSSQTTNLVMNGRTFQHVLDYCPSGAGGATNLCTGNNRLLRVRVLFGGEEVYRAETIYTDLNISTN